MAVAAVDEAHKFQELASRLKRLTSLIAVLVEQQSDPLRYGRDIFQDLFRAICIICLICGDQPARRRVWEDRHSTVDTRKKALYGLTGVLKCFVIVNIFITCNLYLLNSNLTSRWCNNLTLNQTYVLSPYKQTRSYLLSVKKVSVHGLKYDFWNALFVSSFQPFSFLVSSASNNN